MLASLLCRKGVRVSVNILAVEHGSRKMIKKSVDRNTAVVRG